MRAAPLGCAGICAAVLLVAGAAAAQTTPRKPLNPRVALKMGAVGALSDAGIFVALDEGFFRDEGLDIELVSFKNGPQIIPSLATDQTQVSGTAVSPSLFNALARGVDMKLVADKGQVSKGFGWAAIAVRSDLADTIKDYKNLKQKPPYHPKWKDVNLAATVPGWTRFAVAENELQQLRRTRGIDQPVDLEQEFRILPAAARRRDAKPRGRTDAVQGIPGVAGPPRRQAALERDDFSSNRHPAPAHWWSMTFSENRCPLFGITL
jgi:hypothetical protein